MPDSTERRAHPRFPKKIELHAPASDGTVARMMTSDLSEGGIYCVSNTDFPEMTRIAVRLDLDDGPFEAEAVVVRRKPLPSPTTGVTRYELALFFTGIANDKKERLARFLAR